MGKVALFVFNGDPMCFIHVLLNALDFKKKEVDVKVVIEGAATGLIPKLAQTGNPLHGLWQETKGQGLVDGVCRACANKMGTLADAEKEGLRMLDDMSGHPGMQGYRARGYEVITF